MSLTLNVHPLLNVLPMYGELDSSCAYSLSGHISIAVSSSFSLFESRRTARFLLQSVSLTFEGQSEIYTPNTGYSSLRLCSVTRELILSHIELSNEGHEDDSEPSVWNIVFDLPIPGWLPATTTLGLDDLGIRYALYATATFTNIDEEQPSSWGFASLCASFRSRVKSAQAFAPVSIRRFTAAPKTEITDVPMVNYLVNSTANSTRQQLGKEGIPNEVLSQIQVLASVPEYVDVKESALPLTIRLRSKDLAEDYCKRIQVTELGLDLLQQEKCRYRPSTGYLSRFPLPPKEMQPPHLPLRDPHPISSIYDVGLQVSAEVSEAVCRTFSLLPEYDNGQHQLPPDNYVFANDVVNDTPPTWYTMDTSVPFVQRSDRVNRGDAYDSSIEWAGEKDLRPTSDSPLYSVIHELVISLTCTYDLEGRGGEVAREKLSFKIPVSFANVAPRLSVDPPIRFGAEEEIQQHQAVTVHVEPLAMNLPAYSQLYDSNGERKIDYSIPLPLYTPRPPSPPPFCSETDNLLREPSESSNPHLSTIAGSRSVANVNAYHNSIDDEKTPAPLLMEQNTSNSV